jgi:hypothetical protein
VVKYADLALNDYFGDKNGLSKSIHPNTGHRAN